MPLIIGLTGGIGSGKTSASRFFAAEGVDIIDTDVIAHELTNSKGIAIAKIKKYFGNKFITAEGKLNRKKMRNLIFSDIKSRQQLESILHPLILSKVMCRIKITFSPYIIIVIPLLLETGNYHEIVSRVLVIDCNEKDQIIRTVSRGELNEQEVRAIMATQKKREERINHADDIIVNNGNIADLQKQIKIQHNKYLYLLNKN